MATYLVTGGAGFIGSHLTQELASRGHIVKVIDNLSTGFERNLEPVLEDIIFINGDINDPKALAEAMEGVDVVFHQAAIPSVPRSIKDPLASHRANIDGTVSVLEMARKMEVRRVIYAASSSAYGDQDAPTKTEDLPTRPLSPYALQKLTGEQYCQMYSKFFGLETVSLRYFNVFGPRQDPNSPYSAVIPLFIKNALQGTSPTIFGDGSTSRDFTYVANNVHANILAANTRNPDAIGQVVNIAMGESISLNGLLAKVNELLGTQVTAKHQDFRPGDIKHSLASIEKARSLIGYAPIVSFDDGLKLTIEDYRRGFP